MKKLLFISYFFPPVRLIESTLALNVIKYLPEFGWEPTIICAGPARGFSTDVSSLKRIPAHFPVYRTNTVRNVITRGLYHFQLTPCPEIGWFPFAMRTGRTLLQKGSFDALVSRSNPITSHLVGLKLKKEFNLPLVALFGDPWTQNPYISFRSQAAQKRSEKVEGKILNTANRIVVTSVQTKSLLLEKYDDAQKCVVLPNSYDPEDFPAQLFNTITRDQSKYTIVHTGSFYGLRSPEPFLKALSLFLEDRPEAGAKLRVRFLGVDDSFKQLVNRYGLSSVVTCTHSLPREAALKEMISADLLLLIDAPSQRESVFLPGKLAEYFAVKKPILAVTPLRGASADAIRMTKTGDIVAPEDIKGISHAIERFYDLYLDAQLATQPSIDQIEKFSARKYAEQFAAILNQSLHG